MRVEFINQSIPLYEITEIYTSKEFVDRGLNIETESHKELLTILEKNNNKDITPTITEGDIFIVLG